MNVYIVNGSHSHDFRVRGPLINIEVKRYFMRIFVDFFATTGTKLQTEKGGPLPLLRRDRMR